VSNDVALPDEVIARVAARVAELLDDFAEEIDARPTLGEFLEVLGWAVPNGSAALADDVAAPVAFKARVRPNRTYASDRPSRAGELNDAVFGDATDLLSDLAASIRDSTGRAVSAADLASSLSAVLGIADVSFGDLHSADVRGLTVPAAKRGRKPAVGDLLAIPASSGGYHMAVVVQRNQFGTAVGVFAGTSPLPAVTADRRAMPRPIHTDDQSVLAGDWKIVGHDEELLALFPTEPEIYHRPPSMVPGVDLGEFGAAETAAGALRLIDEGEAREVGLRTTRIGRPT
jgi:hypothetical protein